MLTMKYYSKPSSIAFLGIIGLIPSALAFQTPQPETSDTARVLAVLWTGRCQAFLKETESKANGVISSQMIDGRKRVRGASESNYSSFSQLLRSRPSG